MYVHTAMDLINDSSSPVVACCHWRSQLVFSPFTIFVDDSVVAY
ncbi:hypothetical protein HanRHA438_Chr16g0773091 [Helianthus annuus]|nr:hypothetical protein HanRHA438_Chr16g0773091 [Helianthus annuus]